ncbi:HNH endonuclease [Nocardia anaemiae]|uniref:HNH endonuclease n=1 Tax=Nocardia anaemiae TaxID=263910 RepID=UPI000AAADE42|nr:HNH endonuclease [Nocardia anaemiae]
MILITRDELSSRTKRTLRGRQERVDAAADPVKAATASWRSFAGNAREEVLRVLRDMCSGLERCMYCEDSQGTDIDHFRPKATYPESSFTWENYILACSRCNSNHKRNRFPVREGRELLINPTSTDPFRHLALSLTTGFYVGLDDIGETSIDVYGLNRDVCVRGRRTAWIALCALIRDYEKSAATSRTEILETCARFPFQGVRYWLAKVLAIGDRTRTVPEDVREIVEKYRELLP